MNISTGLLDRKILLTGATGYIGGRLLNRIVDFGVPIHRLARRPEFLYSRIGQNVDVVFGDVPDHASFLALSRKPGNKLYINNEILLPLETFFYFPDEHKQFDSMVSQGSSPYRQSGTFDRDSSRWTDHPRLHLGT